MKGLSVLGLWLIIPLSTFAQISGNPENWCRGGFFTRDSDQFSVAKVKGGRHVRAYFYNDDNENCPGSATCRRKAFVVGGDELIVNRAYQGYSCAWYTPKTGQPTVGWIKTSDLVFPAIKYDFSLRAWLGEWTYGENDIDLTDNKLAGFLNVNGTAIWKGIGDNVHVGELDGRYEPVNGIIRYSDGDDEYDCKATLRLLGSYLIVADNTRCGGVNVSFSGIYTRKRIR